MFQMNKKKWFHNLIWFELKLISAFQDSLQILNAIDMTHDSSLNIILLKLSRTITQMFINKIIIIVFKPVIIKFFGKYNKIIL